MTIRLDAHRPEFHRAAPPQLPVRCATTANITIATALNNGDTLDGLTLATGDRVLVKDQTSGSQNGVYIVGVTPARSFDMGEGVAAWGAIILVIAGAVNGGTIWRNTNATLPTIDTTALGFTQIATGGSTGTVEDYDSDLFPFATITSTKDSGNPTFNFDAIPETVLKVGSTYYCVYMTWTGTSVIKLATATDRDGPWTSLSTIWTIGDVAWAAASTSIYAPSLVFDGATYYLFYSIVKTSGATDSGNGIGVATASVITGPYTDHGSAILSPGAGATWDSRRVGEQDVIHHDGRWVMAYMGESSAIAYQDSEKIGVATASSPTGTWTKSAANPVLDWGASGQWDDNLIADPCIVFANGYYWMMYAGGGDPTGNHHPWVQGLAYALDPTAAWTRYSGNPILSQGAGGTWEEYAAWRGALFLEDGLWGGVYGGLDAGAINAKGGNFRLNISVPAAIGGTVTSVALTMPAGFSVSGSPITTSGTLAVTGGTPTDHEHINAVTFSGDGSTTAFELPAAPFDAYAVTAFVAGVRQDVTLSGTLLTTMTFGSAPASGTDNIAVDIVAAAA
ncbi:MAG TPA: family 43 glycosylhydrolase [Verrucomicrobiae bacterium]|nr:family 43 glycosylhydrolase [Verrucomicrobiae bacterium]